jgi:hypothetical protein
MSVEHQIGAMQCHAEPIALRPATVHGLNGKLVVRWSQKIGQLGSEVKVYSGV